MFLKSTRGPSPYPALLLSPWHLTATWYTKMVPLTIRSAAEDGRRLENVGKAESLGGEGAFLQTVSKGHRCKLGSQQGTDRCEQVSLTGRVQCTYSFTRSILFKHLYPTFRISSQWLTTVTKTKKEAPNPAPHKMAPIQTSSKALDNRQS